ncbi:MAG: ChbG/HpnK family deacetylase [Spongiibacteraceae bacterium]
MTHSPEFPDTASPHKRIVLCADDYAQSAAISDGILQLVEQRRLSAVSCFSEADFWSSADNALLDYRDQIDIGLHFNLTQPFARAVISAKSLNHVMGLAISRRIDRQQVTTALRTQLDRFESVAKQMPDFVDGHQHVHVLPVIRAIVIDELTRRYGDKKPYLRAVNPQLSAPGGFIKLFVLKLLGRGFRQVAQQHGLQTNRGFAGIYSLQPQEDFGALMQRWLVAADNGDLLMCHPGAHADNHFSADDFDPIAATRPGELAFLQSVNFADQLAQNAIRLSRFRDIQY